MRYSLSIAVLAMPLGAPAFAQQPAADAPAKTGVLLFPAAFFASSNPGTALDMILRLPGFALDIGDVDSRGLSGAAGNVLIDGSRPSSKSDTLGSVLQRIPASTVERIELIRGGAPGIDMRGRAVIANVVLKRAAHSEIVLESNTFLYDDGAVGPQLKGSWSRREGDKLTEASVSVSSDRTSFTAHGSRTQRDAAGDLLQAADLNQRDHYHDVSALGAIQRPLLGGKLHANAVFDLFTTHDTQNTTITTGIGDDEHVAESTDYPTGELGFTWTKVAGPRSTIELTGLQRLNRNRYVGSADGGGAATLFASTATGGESVLRATDVFRPNARWSIEGGGEVAYNFLDSNSRYAEDGVPIALPNAATMVSELRGEGFVQATWHPSAKLTVDGTMRVELSRISQTGALGRSRAFVYPKPSAQVTWLPATGHQLRLRVEQQVGQLNFGDFAASSEIALGTVAAGNADLRPERSTTIEAVYERRFWKKAVFELTLRHKELVDVIDIIPLVGGFDATGNIGDGRSNYAGAALTLPFDRFGVKDALLKVSGSWTGSRVIDPLTGVARRRAYQSPYECSVTFSHDLKGGHFSYGAEHGCNVDRYTGYRSTEVRTERRPPFAYVYGQWKPSSKLTVQLDLGNLVNGRSNTLRDVYGGPRNTAPLVYSEDRATRRGRYAYLQVRKVL